MTYVYEYTRKSRNKPTEKTKEDIKKKMKEDSKLVKGIFEYVDAKGGYLSFNHRLYPDELIIKYTLVDGETYDLPIGVVKHINNTKKKVTMLGPLDAAGHPTYKIQKTSKIKFIPVDMY